MKKVNFGIRYIDERTAQVSKSFMNKATIFGTEEFKLWREYKKEFPNATMVVKKIKTNENQKCRRNKTYENMMAYINGQPEKEKLIAEFNAVKERAKIQKSPYQYVLNWFEAKFEGYDDLPTFMEEKNAERVAAELAEAAKTAEANEENNNLTIAKSA